MLSYPHFQPIARFLVLVGHGASKMRTNILAQSTAIQRIKAFWTFLKALVHVRAGAASINGAAPAASFAKRCVTDQTCLFPFMKSHFYSIG